MLIRKSKEKLSEFPGTETGKESEEFNEFPPLKIKWHYLLFNIWYHTVGMYGLYLCFTETKWQTIVFLAILDVLTILGVTAGAHRLWSHRSYKASLPLRIFLAFIFTFGWQHSISHWVLDHRLHHKYSETNADPHNAKRGFLYSHILWLVTYKTEDCEKKCATIDLSDLKADPVVRFQWKYYYILTAVIAVFLPTVIPILLWEETLLSALAVAVHLRLLLTLHQTFLVNSVAHKWGYRPYDETIYPTDNSLVTMVTVGEGFHNFHHTFPSDYRTSEFGTKVNLTTAFIDFMVWLGLASNCKIAPMSVIESKKSKIKERRLT